MTGLISSLWELCNASQSHICEVVVPLLLHCITLPSGSDTFWRVVQEDFHHTDWRVRFISGSLSNLIQILFALYVQVDGYESLIFSFKHSGTSNCDSKIYGSNTTL